MLQQRRHSMDSIICWLVNKPLSGPICLIIQKRSILFYICRNMRFLAATKSKVCLQKHAHLCSQLLKKALLQTTQNFSHQIVLSLSFSIPAFISTFHRLREKVNLQCSQWAQWRSLFVVSIRSENCRKAELGSVTKQVTFRKVPTGGYVSGTVGTFPFLQNIPRPTRCAWTLCGVRHFM